MAFYTELTHTPTNLVVTLAKAKKQLKIESAFTEEDDLIQGYIDAAIVQAENYINSVIYEKKFQITGASFTDLLSFKKQRIKAITGISYLDLSGTSQTLATSEYKLDQVDKFEYNVKFEADLPDVKLLSDVAVTLNVTLGFSKMPSAIVQAVLLLVSDMYEYRSDRSKKTHTTAFNLLAPYRYFMNE